MNYLCLSTSLSPDSRSRIMLRVAYECLKRSLPDTKWMDVAEMNLPICDGHAAYDHEHAQRVRAAVEVADGILLAFGIYNYGPSAIVKTTTELAGRALDNKVVGCICAAGGPGAYMAGLPLMNGLMLDFRTVIVPRFVFTTGKSFQDDQLIDEDITTRLAQLADELVRMTTALRSESAPIE